MKRILFTSLFTALLLAACGTGNEEIDPNENSVDIDINENMNSDLNENEPASEENDAGGDNTTTNEENQDSNNEPMDVAGSSYEYGVKDFELELDFQDGTEWDFDYENENDDNKEGEIEKENGEEIDLSGTEAIEEIEEMLQAINVTPETSDEDAIAEILSHLNVNEEDLTKFELEIDFHDGTELNVNGNF